MGIFAGAQRNDSWVVLPQVLSRQKEAGADQLWHSTLGRAADRAIAGADTNAPSPLPRNVDAVIDPDPHASTEERGRTDSSHTLRMRGLSDLSIHEGDSDEDEEGPLPQVFPPERRKHESRAPKMPEPRSFALSLPPSVPTPSAPHVCFPRACSRSHHRSRRLPYFPRAFGFCDPCLGS